MHEFTQFLDRSPSVFHAAHEIGLRLKGAGFTLLKEGEKWKLEPGKGYYLVRQDTLIAAFRTPKKAPRAAILLASHIDSPCLKLKPQPELISHGIGQLGTEVYGGPLLHAWLDRDLRISGRLTGLDAKGACYSILVSLDDCPVIIPQLAIHLDRSIHEKGILVHKQDHLKPIFSFRSREKQWDHWLAKHHAFSQLLSFDLFLTPLEKASFLGFDKELIASYRLDNLTSAFASLKALIEAAPSQDHLQMALFWDHEEIGSLSYVGADSLFANQVIERICMHYKMDREDYYQMKSRSLCLSADLAHGYHPNYSDKYDAQNASFVGKGVVIKFNANQKYATSSATAAPLIRIAETHKIPIQKFAGRSDIPSGSTVGSIMAANLGVPTLDLGISGWAMHSTREVVAAEDQLSLERLLKAALEEPFSEAP